MSEDSAAQKCTVLIADDSEDDRFFLKAAIARDSRLKVIGELEDGEEAIAYLSGRGAFGNRELHPLPDILLLDLKMPRKTGHEVLHWLHTQSFRQLRVVIVSGSALPEDILRSRALGADAYLKKSALHTEQTAMIREIEAVCARQRAQQAASI